MANSIFYTAKINSSKVTQSSRGVATPISPWTLETESLARDCITEAAAVDHGSRGVRPGRTLMTGFDTLRSQSVLSQQGSSCVCCVLPAWRGAGLETSVCFRTSPTIFKTGNPGTMPPFRKGLYFLV